MKTVGGHLFFQFVNRRNTIFNTKNVKRPVYVCNIIYLFQLLNQLYSESDIRIILRFNYSNICTHFRAIGDRHADVIALLTY